MGNKKSREEPQESKFWLETEQRKAIREYWPDLKKRRPQVFQSTWLTIIESSPAIRESFGIGAYDDPQVNPTFLGVTESVEQFFYDLIHTYQFDKEKCSDVCHELGIRHARSAERGVRGFQAVHWDIFMSTLMSTIEEQLDMRGQKRIRLISSWQSFIQLMVEHIRAGYDITRKESALIRKVSTRKWPEPE